MRDATGEELEAVAATIEALAPGLWRSITGGHGLAVVERDGARFAVLATQPVLALPAELLAGAEAGGLAIGTLEGPEASPSFHLDLQGAVLVARHTRNQTVRVTEHASRLFMYGRNILGPSVEYHDPSLERGDACIVTNTRNEAVGLGVVVGSLSGQGEAVKPVADLGTYLRDQDSDEA